MNTLCSYTKQLTLAAYLRLQVDSFTLRTRLNRGDLHVPSHPQQGFTLAELLIALALLGIIAAFTIPKVLQASSEQETNAKLRETVAALENAWYTARAQNALTTDFRTTIIPLLNTVASGQGNTGGPGEINGPGGPLASAPATHPCTEGPGVDNAYWFTFANGVLVSTPSGNPSVSLDNLPYNDPSHDEGQNMIFCIDVNSAAGPNQPGQDIFFGNFNQYGGFFGPPATMQESLKSFRWGNRTQNIMHESTNIYSTTSWPNVGDGTRNPCALVGCRLTQ